MKKIVSFFVKYMITLNYTSWGKYTYKTIEQEDLVKHCTTIIPYNRPYELIIISVFFFLRSFNSLIGDLNELKEKDYGDEARGAQR